MLPGMTNNTSAADVAAQLPAPTTDQLLAELEASDLSTAAFARKRGLPPWKLYNALTARAAKCKKRAKRSNLVSVTVKPERAARAVPLELQLATGHRLLVPADFDEQALRRLMGVLAGC